MNSVWSWLRRVIAMCMCKFCEWSLWYGIMSIWYVDLKSLLSNIFCKVCEQVVFLVWSIWYGKLMKIYIVSAIKLYVDSCIQFSHIPHWPIKSPIIMSIFIRSPHSMVCCVLTTKCSAYYSSITLAPESLYLLLKNTSINIDIKTPST